MCHLTPASCPNLTARRRKLPTRHGLQVCLWKFCFSAISEVEFRQGAAVLPVGRHRETLIADIERLLRTFAGRTAVNPGISVTGR